MNMISFNGESLNLFLDAVTRADLSGDRLTFLSRRDDLLIFKVDTSVGRKLNRPENAEHYFVNIDHELVNIDPFGKAICEMQFDSVESMLVVRIPPVEARPAARGRRPKSLEIASGKTESIGDLVRRLNSLIDDETMVASVVDNRLRISMQVTFE